jgi:hypothetical protein
VIAEVDVADGAVFEGQAQSLVADDFYGRDVYQWLHGV